MRLRISFENFWHNINDNFKTGGGIYILSCTDQMGNTIRIGRLLGEDPDGILYIGKADTFLNRVIELKKSLSPKHVSQSHECGARHKSNEAISQRFPYDQLQIDLIADDNPRVAEQKALASYLTRYGELPPFNRVF